MNTDTEIARRTRRYWFDDGLVELAGGIVFAVVGLLFALIAANGGIFAGLAPTLFLVVLLPAPLAVLGIRASKERLTYPRTGYVIYRRPTLTDRAVRGATLVAVGATILLITLAASRGAQAWLAAIPTLTLTGLLLVPAWRLGLRRYYMLAVTILVLGCAAELFAKGATAQAALVYGGAGLALIVSGAWTMRSYLHQPRTANDLNG